MSKIFRFTEEIVTLAQNAVGGGTNPSSGGWRRIRRLRCCFAVLPPDLQTILQ